MVTDEYRAIPIFRDLDQRAMMAPADARRAFYQDCDASVADWAVARLRPQSPRPLLDPWPLSAWPDVSWSVILARDDRALALAAGMDAARVVLDGAEPIVLDGGHSPFLSRPGELADVLCGLGRAR